MKENRNNLLQRCLIDIINIGIHPDLPLVESRRVKLLNIMALLCMPFFLIYPVINFLQERYWLFGLNLINMASLLLLLLMHQYRLYLSARLIRIFFSITIFTLSGIFYQSGTEYCLIGTLVISLFVFDNKWLVAGLSIVIIGAVLSILAHPVLLPGAVPITPERRYAVLIISLFFIIVSIVFYKYIQSDYQREIEKQQQALLAMNRDKEKLFSIVSHDIKSPLQSLEKMLHIYRDGLLEGKEMAEATDSLHKKILQLNDTVDTLLKWSMHGMSGIQTHPSSFPVLGLVKEMVNFSDLMVQQKNITVKINVPEQLQVFADRDQLSVVLRNLLNNALKFSYSGGQVDIFAEDNEKSAAIYIRDHGMGMDESLLKRLFSAPHNPAYGTNGERGSGLGLLLCEEFTRKNNGSIHVESTPGKGTCFGIVLQKESK